MSGGAMPHRLGLSETVLIFKQHIELIGGFKALLAKMPELKIECIEKKILAETNDYGEARTLCEVGVDGIQFDKMPTSALKEVAAKIKKEFPKVILLAAGGVNEKNISEYAETNVDGIVTTSLYNAAPTDIGVRINRL
jgi:molybdenum transport protein